MGSLTLGLPVLAGLLTLAGLVFFVRPRWFMGWVKGTLAFTLVLVGLGLFLLAWDLTRYYRLSQEVSVASLSIQQLGNQQWQVSLDSANLPEARQSFLLEGDQWQLDARVLRFAGPLEWLGLQPVYRLERLSGRYLSLEQAQARAPSVHGLGGESVVDFWALDQRFGLPLLESQFGSATFMPLQDNARYLVRLGNSGLNAVPMNDEAKAAVSGWQ